MALSTVVKRWEFVADTSQAERSLRNVQNELNKTDKAQDKVNKTGIDVKTNFENLKKAASGLSSSVGGATGQVGDLVEGLSGLVGGLGASTVAIGGTVAAAAGLVAVMYSVVDSANESVNALKEMGVTDPLPPERLQSIRDYENASKELSKTWNLLKVQAGSELAPAFTTLIGLVNDIITTFDRARDKTSGFTRVLAGIATLGASEAILTMKGAYDRTYPSIDKTTESVKELNGALEEQNDVTEDGQTPVREVIRLSDIRLEKQKKYIEEQKRLNGELSVLETLQDMIIESNSDLMSDEEKLTLAHMKRVESIQKIGAEYSDNANIQAAANAAILSEEEKLNRELQKLRDDRQETGGKDPLASAISSGEGLSEMINDLIKTQEKQLEEFNKEMVNFGLATAGAINGLVGDLFDTLSQGMMDKVSETRAAVQEQNDILDDYARKVADGTATYQDRIAAKTAANQKAALDRQLADQKKAATQLAIAQKAQSLFQVGIDSVVLGLSLSAPPPVGLGPVAGPAFAIAAGAVAATAITAQPLPEFPTGGIVSPDHQLIGAQSGEAVLNRSAVRRIGVDGVNNLNRGTGNMSSQNVYFKWRNDLYDVTLRDSLKDPRSVISTIAAGGKITGHRSR